MSLEPNSFGELIVDAITGEEIFRPYDESELLEIAANKKILDTELAQIAAKNEARKAVLDKLGLTEDEMKLITG